MHCDVCYYKSTALGSFNVLRSLLRAVFEGSDMLKEDYTNITDAVLVTKTQNEMT